MKRTAHNSSAKLLADGGPTCWAVAGVLAVLIGIIYLPAANVPLIFDDLYSITKNETIVSLWPLVGITKPGLLNPPPEQPTAGRPLVNLSFAINYQIGGLNPVGYHVVNIAIHYFNALLLWALVRRTLRLPYFDGRFDQSAEWLSFGVATLWALHPLQTESVIYATQRTELMMAFFYFATLYCSLRYWELGTSEARPETTPNRRSRSKWIFFATVACLCGMASKEVMISAPLIVLLFERTFISGTLANCFRRSWPLYVGLASTSLLLAGLAVTDPRPDSAGFHLGIPPHVWWFTQSQIMFLYLKLVIWPWPLLIHYEWPYITSFADAWFYVVPLLLVGFLTAFLLWKNRPLGFLGTFFFAILSPTFVIPVVTEMAAERRMYLPLAPLMLILVFGIYRCARLLDERRAGAVRPSSLSARLAWAGVPIVILAVISCVASASRLAKYDNELNLWMEVMQAQPENPRAHLYAATFFEHQGSPNEAIHEYEAAIRLHPNPVEAHLRLGQLLVKTGNYSEAAKEFAASAQGLPTKNASVCNSEAGALYMAGRNDEAIAAYLRALDIDPKFWPAHRNLGTAYQKAGRFQNAVHSFQTALELNPRGFDIYSDLANSYFRLKQKPQAIAALEHGLQLAEAAGDAENVKKLSAALQANH